MSKSRYEKLILDEQIETESPSPTSQDVTPVYQSRGGRPISAPPQRTHCAPGAVVPLDPSDRAPRQSTKEFPRRFTQDRPEPFPESSGSEFQNKVRLLPCKKGGPNTYPPIVTIDGRVDTDIDHLIEDIDSDEVTMEDRPSCFPRPHVFSVIDGSLDDDVDGYANDDGTMEHSLVDAPKKFHPKDLQDVASSDAVPKTLGRARGGQMAIQFSDRSYNKKHVEPSNMVDDGEMDLSASQRRVRMKKSRKASLRKSKEEEELKEYEERYGDKAELYSDSSRKISKCPKSLACERINISKEDYESAETETESVDSKSYPNETIEYRTVIEISPMTQRKFQESTESETTSPPKSRRATLEEIMHNSSTKRHSLKSGVGPGRSHVSRSECDDSTSHREDIPDTAEESFKVIKDDHSARKQCHQPNADVYSKKIYRRENTENGKDKGRSISNDKKAQNVKQNRKGQNCSYTQEDLQDSKNAKRQCDQEKGAGCVSRKKETLEKPALKTRSIERKRMKSSAELEEEAPIEQCYQNHVAEKFIPFRSEFMQKEFSSDDDFHYRRRKHHSNDTTSQLVESHGQNQDRKEGRQSPDRKPLEKKYLDRTSAKQRQRSEEKMESEEEPEVFERKRENLEYEERRVGSQDSQQIKFDRQGIKQKQIKQGYEYEKSAGDGRRKKTEEYKRQTLERGDKKYRDNLTQDANEYQRKGTYCRIELNGYGKEETRTLNNKARLRTRPDDYSEHSVKPVRKGKRVIDYERDYTINNAKIPVEGTKDPVHRNEEMCRPQEHQLSMLEKDHQLGKDDKDLDKFIVNEIRSKHDDVENEEIVIEKAEASGMEGVHHEDCGSVNREAEQKQTEKYRIIHQYPDDQADLTGKKDSDVTAAQKPLGVSECSRKGIFKGSNIFPVSDIYGCEREPLEENGQEHDGSHEKYQAKRINEQSSTCEKNKKENILEMSNSELKDSLIEAVKVAKKSLAAAAKVAKVLNAVMLASRTPSQSGESVTSSENLPKYLSGLTGDVIPELCHRNSSPDHQTDSFTARKNSKHNSQDSRHYAVKEAGLPIKNDEQFLSKLQEGALSKDHLEASTRGSKYVNHRTKSVSSDLANQRICPHRSESVSPDRNSSAFEFRPQHADVSGPLLTIKIEYPGVQGDSTVCKRAQLNEAQTIKVGLKDKFGVSRARGGGPMIELVPVSNDHGNDKKKKIRENQITEHANKRTRRIECKPPVSINENGNYATVSEDDYPEVEESLGDAWHYEKMAITGSWITAQRKMSLPQASPSQDSTSEEEFKRSTFPSSSPVTRLLNMYKTLEVYDSSLNSSNNNSNDYLAESNPTDISEHQHIDNLDLETRPAGNDEVADPRKWKDDVCAAKARNGVEGNNIEKPSEDKKNTVDVDVKELVRNEPNKPRKHVRATRKEINNSLKTAAKMATKSLSAATRVTKALENLTDALHVKANNDYVISSTNTSPLNNDNETTSNEQPEAPNQKRQEDTTFNFLSERTEYLTKSGKTGTPDLYKRRQYNTSSNRSSTPDTLDPLLVNHKTQTKHHNEHNLQVNPLVSIRIVCNGYPTGDTVNKAAEVADSVKPHVIQDDAAQIHASQKLVISTEEVALSPIHFFSPDNSSLKKGNKSGDCVKNIKDLRTAYDDASDIVNKVCTKLAESKEEGESLLRNKSFVSHVQKVVLGELRKETKTDATKGKLHHFVTKCAQKVFDDLLYDQERGIDKDNGRTISSPKHRRDNVRYKHHITTARSNKEKLKDNYEYRKHEDDGKFRRRQPKVSPPSLHVDKSEAARGKSEEEGRLPADRKESRRKHSRSSKTEPAQNDSDHAIYENGSDEMQPHLFGQQEKRADNDERKMICEKVKPRKKRSCNNQAADMSHPEPVVEKSCPEEIPVLEHHTEVVKADLKPTKNPIEEKNEQLVQMSNHPRDRSQDKRQNQRNKETVDDKQQKPKNDIDDAERNPKENEKCHKRKRSKSKSLANEEYIMMQKFNAASMGSPVDPVRYYGSYASKERGEQGSLSPSSTEISGCNKGSSVDAKGVHSMKKKTNYNDANSNRSRSFSEERQLYTNDEINYKARSKNKWSNAQTRRVKAKERFCVPVQEISEPGRFSPEFGDDRKPFISRHNETCKDDYGHHLNEIPNTDATFENDMHNSYRERRVSPRKKAYRKKWKSRERKQARGTETRKKYENNQTEKTNNCCKESFWEATENENNELGDFKDHRKSTMIPKMISETTFVCNSASSDEWTNVDPVVSCRGTGQNISVCDYDDPKEDEEGLKNTSSSFVGAYPLYRPLGSMKQFFSPIVEESLISVIRESVYDTSDEEIHQYLRSRRREDNKNNCNVHGEESGTDFNDNIGHKEVRTKPLAQDEREEQRNEEPEKYPIQMPPFLLEREKNLQLRVHGPQPLIYSASTRPDVFPHEPPDLPPLPKPVKIPQSIDNFNKYLKNKELARKVHKIRKKEGCYFDHSKRGVKMAAESSQALNRLFTLESIARDNEKIFHRLLGQRSKYGREDMLKDYERKLPILAAYSRYPEELLARKNIKKLKKSPEETGNLKAIRANILVQKQIKAIDQSLGCPQEGCKSKFPKPRNLKFLSEEQKKHHKELDFSHVQSRYSKDMMEADFKVHCHKLMRPQHDNPDLPKWYPPMVTHFVATYGHTLHGRNQGKANSMVKKATKKIIKMCEEKVYPYAPIKRPEEELRMHLMKPFPVKRPKDKPEPERKNNLKLPQIDSKSVTPSKS